MAGLSLWVSKTAATRFISFPPLTEFQLVWVRHPQSIQCETQTRPSLKSPSESVKTIILRSAEPVSSFQSVLNRKQNMAENNKRRSGGSERFPSSALRLRQNVEQPSETASPDESSDLAADESLTAQQYPRPH